MGRKINTRMLLTDSGKDKFPSLSKKARGMRTLVRVKSGGIGGTLKSISRKNRPPVRVKWKATVFKGMPTTKARKGIGIKVEF